MLPSANSALVARPRQGGNWFVGAWPPADVATEVAQWSSSTLAGGAWRTGHALDLHATMAFLGRLDEERGTRLAGELRAQLHGWRGTRLHLGELRGFPVEDPAKRIAYLAIADGEGGSWWRETEARIARACARAGLARPAAGTPHLTVGRPRSARAPLLEGPSPGWDFQVDALHLACRAEGGRNGRYMSFARLPLG
jgi:2'-5' RNA ligase